MYIIHEGYYGTVQLDMHNVTAFMLYYCNVHLGCYAKITECTDNYAAIEHTHTKVGATGSWHLINTKSALFKGLTRVCYMRPNLFFLSCAA